MVVSRHTVERFSWGQVCDGWRLLDQEHFSIIEESVPPGAGEAWHVHDRAHQFFYVLGGTASFDLVGEASFVVTSGEGIAVEPGRAHRISNPDDSADVHFLVISAPSTRGDRREVSPKVNVE